MGDGGNRSPPKGSQQALRESLVNMREEAIRRMERARSESRGGRPLPDLPTPAPLTPADLKEIRTRLNVSQKRLAEAIGVSPRMWQYYESGEHDVPPWLTNLLCIMLDYRIEAGLTPARQSDFNRVTREAEQQGTVWYALPELTPTENPS